MWRFSVKSVRRCYSYNTEYGWNPVLLSQAIGYMKQHGVTVKPAQIWYAQSSGSLPKPGKDAMGMYDYTLYVERYLEYFRERGKPENN